MLPPTSVGSDDDCPLDLPAVQGGGFSVLGEAAVAGMDAATLEQHAAWVDNATVDRRASRRTPERETARTPDAEAELIAALVAAVAVTGRITELRRPEPVVDVRRPAPVLALLDLAMPRDIDAAAHRLAGVRLVDIESLAEVLHGIPDQHRPVAGMQLHVVVRRFHPGHLGNRDQRHPVPDARWNALEPWAW